jgi:lipopolysaccharide/colanic/teichoic acid biosynthesis glycosyltransferase
MPRPVTLDDILIADAYYIATRSWRIDMGILARTPLVWLQRRIHKHSELKDTQEYYRRVDEVSGI